MDIAVLYRRIEKVFQGHGFTNVVVYHLDTSEAPRWTAKIRAELHGGTMWFKAGGADNEKIIYTWNDIEASIQNSGFHVGAEIAPEKSRKMKIEEFIRRPFDVNAVQVTPQNAAEVAEWCGGKVAKSTYKLAGFDTQLDCVKVPGNGPNKGKMVEARIGSYVVEHEGNFRVFRKQQFHDTFLKRNNESPQWFHVGDLVQDQDGDQGEVVKVEQILVDAPALGHVLYSREELTRIREYSDKTMEHIKEEARVAAIVPGLDKINSMRASEETHQAITQAFESQQGDLDDPQVIESIGDIKLGTCVRIVDESNQFFSQIGEVEAFINDTTVAVKMEMLGGQTSPEIVNHLVREVQIEADTKWGRVSNENSAQFGWVGWVVKDTVDSDLVRLAFRPVNYLDNVNDRCFSYMPDEVEVVWTTDLGQIPTYHI